MGKRRSKGSERLLEEARMRLNNEYEKMEEEENICGF